MPKFFNAYWYVLRAGMHQGYVQVVGTLTYETHPRCLFYQR